MIAVLVQSMSGNTDELADLIIQKLHERGWYAEKTAVRDLPDELDLHQIEGILFGTYTWGNGEIPRHMKPALDRIKSQDLTATPCGIFGTGDSFYPHFCGAVDRLRSLLKLVTGAEPPVLKVELLPQPDDEERIASFVQAYMEHVESVKQSHFQKRQELTR
ncbi:flavodoxin domain-containing protein [Bacillus daqingensis]|uniref:Flavodoxin domain-containing protein n=1 Tax=Bacillus daqingensis TaxID=872396 RepID=A0ABV9NNY8_9BACI